MSGIHGIVVTVRGVGPESIKNTTKEFFVFLAEKSGLGVELLLL